MTNQKRDLSQTTLPKNYQALFEQLPPLGSEEYIRLMENADGAKIPPQVLALLPAVVPSQQRSGDESYAQQTAAKKKSTKSNRFDEKQSSARTRLVR